MSLWFRLLYAGFDASSTLSSYHRMSTRSIIIIIIIIFIPSGVKIPRVKSKVIVVVVVVGV